MTFQSEKEALVSRLADREELLTSITANIPGVVYQFYAHSNGQWGMHFVSEKAQEIFGISSDPESFLDEFMAHLPEQDRALGIESITGAVAREIPWVFEGRFLRPDGKEIFFRGNAVPKRKGEELVFDGIFLDITEQRHAEREREEQARILQATTNNLPGVVYEFFTDPDGAMGMRYVSERAEEIFGIPSEPSQFVERFIACIPEPDRESFVTSILEAVAKEGPWHYQGNFERPDGTMVHFRGDSVPSRRRDRLVFHGILLDLTEQRRMEEELRHSQKLDSIGQLAGGVAHDFNNMLGGIMGAAELLQERLASDPKSAALAQLILETSERAGELTWQLLAFSRKAVRLRKPQKVHELIQHTIKILERSIDPRIKIECDLKAPDETVRGDAGQLQAAFLNLGVNARDAMPEGGCLRFESAVVHVQKGDASSKVALSPGRYLRIRVSDTGTGIPLHVRERVFEPFFTTKPLGQGTGMGLAAVYGTMAEHKGSVSILESSGRGTCFQILLPLSDDSADSERPTSPQQSSLAEGRVLFVDDEDIVRTTATRLMESLGYKVDAFGDPQAAVEHFEAHSDDYSIAMLDMVMPSLNGEEVFRLLRTIRGDLPVVLCSGFALDESVVRLRGEGLAGHLKKPFRREDLREALRGALERAALS